jgi:cell division protein FtsW (lipid II flippase)
MLRGSIPPTGIPMPFASAGGTRLSVFMGAIGILCNIGKNKENREEFKKSKMAINLFKSKKKKENRI